MGKRVKGLDRFFDLHLIFVDESIMHLQITIVKIRGYCPVYREGDRFYLREGYILDVRKSCPVCIHSLASLMPYYVALRRGVNPKELGLSPAKDQPARIQCLDPCEYTGGGTVIFEITEGDADGNNKTG
jgi:uncharacterized repeat protein (TIGR04076 family)